jgi:hypothetical protein
VRPDENVQTLSGVGEPSGAERRMYGFTNKAFVRRKSIRRSAPVIRQVRAPVCNSENPAAQIESPASINYRNRSSGRAESAQIYRPKNGRPKQPPK